GRHRTLADIVRSVLEHAAATFRARAERLLAREVDDLPAFCRVAVLTEVELQFPVLLFVVVLEHDLGREGPAGLGAEAVQRAASLVAQQLLDFLHLESAAGWRLAERKAAALQVGFARLA